MVLSYFIIMIDKKIYLTDETIVNYLRKKNGEIEENCDWGIKYGQQRL